MPRRCQPCASTGNRSTPRARPRARSKASAGGVAQARAVEVNSFATSKVVGCDRDFELEHRRVGLLRTRLGELDLVDDQKLLRGLDRVEKLPDVGILTAQRKSRRHARQPAIAD